MIRSLKQLRSQGLLNGIAGFEELDEKKSVELQQVEENFGLSIPHQMAELLSNQSIAKQFLPSTEELLIDSNELYDPIADFPHTPVKGLVHRYQDRCLLKPVNMCAVYCRFCFRREFIGSNNSESLTKEELKAAYQYIRNHPEIWEVILTGGDPLMLKPKQLSEILQQLQQIEHVAVLRIHTRIPVVASDKMTASMIKALSTEKPLYVVLHANHPDEFTAAAKEACHKIVKAGIPMLSQSVLLKDINDDPETLGKLMRTFVENRIKPYYLHHPDMVRGTSHFRTSIEAGKELMKQLKKHYSGLCQVSYVCEVPGGGEKIQLA